MTRRRKLLFALVALAMSVVFSLILLFAADLYVHRKFADAGGLNTRGYRGELVGRKAEGERRVLVVGGSTALGYGVRANEAIPAVLQSLLNTAQPGQAAPPRVSVVNLGYNNAGVDQFTDVLEDYAYLSPDLVVFYTGYNDLVFTDTFALQNRDIGRRSSALFRWIGYFPMLPMVAKEKAMAIRYGGELDAAYKGRQTAFKPSALQRSQAALLEAMGRIGDSLDQPSTGATRPPARAPKDPAAIECAQYTDYCDALGTAIQYAIDHGARVLVVTEPYISAIHREQQALSSIYVRKRFRDAARVGLANLGTAVDLSDPAMDRDGSHLTPLGSRRVAERLVAPVTALLAGRADAEAIVEPAMANASSPLAAPAVTEPHRVGETRIAPVDQRAMTWVPAGAFVMGSPTSELQRDVDETPSRVVIARGFWLDVAEVTNAAYRRFVAAVPEWSPSRVAETRPPAVMGRYVPSWQNGEPPAADTDLPVTGVPWAMASAYCAWAGKRLPTEAEWEYAARAGSTTAFWWGDAFAATHANVQTSGALAASMPARVNPWGLADMSGNVWEWTSSVDAPYPYRADDGREGPDPSGWKLRVIRGGAWPVGPAFARSADRVRYNPRVASAYVGFRCAANGA